LNTSLSLNFIMFTRNFKKKKLEGLIFIYDLYKVQIKIIFLHVKCNNHQLMFFIIFCNVSFSKLRPGIITSPFMTQFSYYPLMRIIYFRLGWLWSKSLSRRQIQDFYYPLLRTHQFKVRNFVLLWSPVNSLFLWVFFRIAR